MGETLVMSVKERGRVGELQRVQRGERRPLARRPCRSLPNPALARQPARGRRRGTIRHQTILAVSNELAGWFAYQDSIFHSTE